MLEVVIESRHCRAASSAALTVLPQDVTRSQELKPFETGRVDRWFYIEETPLARVQNMVGDTY